MGKRREDWTDLLSSYALALKPSKIYAGYLATLFTVFIMLLACLLYSLLDQWGLLAAPSAEVIGLGRIFDLESDSLLFAFLNGTGLSALRDFLVILNPLYDGSIAHFVLSLLTYLALFWVWSGAGGVISRLTALEYARDELPTLADGRQMVRSKRMAYFLAPTWPLLFFAGMALLNLLGGLVASIPYVGRILLIVPGLPLLLITSGLMVLIAFFGVLSFGMMAPAISVGGKDALDGWSTSYTYVLWGSGRYICYTLTAAVVGVVSTIIVWLLTESLIWILVQSVNLGFVAGTPWVQFSFGGVLADSGTGGFNGAMSTIVAILLLAVRALPVAYAIAYFFAANTVVFFLLRKHVDNIDVEEVYTEEEPEEVPEEQPAEVAAAEEEAPAEEEKAPAEAPGAEEEKAPAEEEAPAEPAPEEEKPKAEEPAEEKPEGNAPTPRAQQKPGTEPAPEDED